MSLNMTRSNIASRGTSKVYRLKDRQQERIQNPHTANFERGVYINRTIYTTAQLKKGVVPIDVMSRNHSRIHRISYGLKFIAH